MLRIISTLFLCSCLFLTYSNINSVKELDENLSSNSLRFIENKGQIVDQNHRTRHDILFGGRSKGLTFHLRNNGISYQLFKEDKWKEIENHKTKKKQLVSTQQTIFRIDINWINAATNTQIIKEKESNDYLNYYTVGCPDEGILGVKSYEEITYKNLYHGIDLKWYEKNGELKYDFLCNPGSNYKQIQLEINGADEIYINDNGELVIKTPLGLIIEKAPLVFQCKKVLKSSWIIKKNIACFEIENLNSNLPFCIDPGVRLWCTYYGADGHDEGFSCSLDATGNVFMTGYTGQTWLLNISTVGSHQYTIGGGSFDAFLVKFSSMGIRQWGTYYGGAGIEYAYACTTDLSGNIFITGEVDDFSTTGISTAGSHQSTHGGGSSWSTDAFLVKFSPSGVRQWGTYYGGTGSDYSYSCATDALGNVYITGLTKTTSGTIIATTGSHQPNFGGGNYDGFLAKFNSLGIRTWATYYGDNGDDCTSACTTDAFGNVYLAGDASGINSGTTIATPGSHQPNSGGSGDAYLVKFDSAGIRQWGTYYGGVNGENSTSCCVDKYGNVIMTGVTTSNSGSGIATPGSHQFIYGGGISDAFLVKFNSIGTRQWGTYYGGTFKDGISSCTSDSTGNIYIAGSTESSVGTGISTANGFQPNHNGGNSDGYVVKFSSTGLRLLGSYYGGPHYDYIFSCISDSIGNLYFSGSTLSAFQISSSGSHQPNFESGWDAFLAKLKNCAAPTLTASVKNTICDGDSLKLKANVLGTTTGTYYWTGPNSFTANVQNPIIPNAGTINIGIYTVSINNTGCIETNTTNLYQVLPTPTITTNSSLPNFACLGQTATLTASGAFTYTWNPTPSGPVTGSVLTIYVNATSSYTVIGTSANTCTNSSVITQSMSPCTNINELSSSNVSIYPNPATNEFYINIGSLDPLNVKFKIINNLGQLIIDSSAERGENTIDISNLSRGVYLVKIILNNIDITNYKIIKN